MKPIAISVVIPTYNYAHLIERAIQSVLRQSLPPVELIVVDDGSTDDTARIVSRCLNQALPFKMVYFQQPNAGVSAARNLGIRQARGDYLSLLDADDALRPGGLASLAEPVQRDPGIDLVFGGCVDVRVDGHRKIKTAERLTPDRAGNFKAYIRRKLRISNIGRLLIRRSAFDRIHFPEHIRTSEDRSVFAQLVATCQGVSIDAPVIELYAHEKSLSRNQPLMLAYDLQVVDAVFDPAILPSDLMRYKTDFYVRRCLSLFRRCYRIGSFREAEHYYRLAVFKSPLALFRWPYLRKYLRMKFGQSWSRSK